MQTEKSASRSRAADKSNKQQDESDEAEVLSDTRSNNQQRKSKRNSNPVQTSLAEQMPKQEDYETDDQGKDDAPDQSFARSPQNNKMFNTVEKNGNRRGSDHSNGTKNENFQSASALMAKAGNVKKSSKKHKGFNDDFLNQEIANIQ